MKKFMTLYEWNNIKKDFQQATLILGNGFSIGIYEKFLYNSLWEEAKKQPPCDKTREPLTEELCSLAEELNTGTNFELLLRQLYTAKVVNEKLKLDAEHIVECNYDKLRNALIETIQEIHCEHNEAKCELSKRIDFLKQFNTVFSLSYDLLVYWIINLNNQIEEILFEKAKPEYYHKQKTLKDCWDKDGFNYDDWAKYREPFPNEKNRTLVFFPHGALHLVQTENGVVEKIKSTKDSDLLSIIERVWLNDSDKKHPLFVAEGNQHEKLRAIQSNTYLNTVYQQILPSSIKDNKLVIFGWAMSDVDEHLIQKITSSKPTEIAIGIHHLCDKEECNRISSQLRNLNLNNCALKFFEIDNDFFE